jgi:ribosomal protein S18 acetylase RimI-like enzyme
MKSKLRTQKRVCYFSDLNEEEKHRCNEVCKFGFGGELYFYENCIEKGTKNQIISLLYVDDLIIGICFAQIKRKKVMKPLSQLFLFVHTVSIDPDFRGKGLCYHLVRNLLNAKINIEGKIYHLGRSLNMYLQVKTNETDPNISAIKCYQKNGFELVDMMHETRNDGQILTTMIRKKGSTKTKSKTKKAKKTKRK